MSEDPEVAYGLIRLGERVSVRQYLRDIWARREFAVAVPLGDLRAQNMDTVLGNLWHLLNPLLMVAVYFLVFGLLLGTRRGVDNFLAFLTVGVFTFHYTQKSVLASAKAVVSNEGLIRSIQFPRALLPISTIVGQTVAFLPALALMLVVAMLNGVAPRFTWLLLLLVVPLQALFNLGAGFIVARLTEKFRDLENVLPFIFRIIFYLSGTIYDVSRYGDNEFLLSLLNVNPVFAFIEIARNFVLHVPVEGWAFLSVGVWSVGLLAAGFLYFRAGEASYGRA